MKRLIVNADDFGLTAGVNEAILHLHQRGRLTSATLMAHAAASDEAMRLALATPTLGVGCHVVLVDGQPILNPNQLPTLVDQRTGRFRTTLGRFVRDLLQGKIDRDEIVAEATAQIEYLRALGLRLSHVDTHKHTHIFSAVRRPLLLAARNNGITAIRNPFEPSWSLSATAAAPFLRRIQVHILNRMRVRFRSDVANAGLSTTDGAVGVLATGTLDTSTLNSLLNAMPDGCWELVTHPGYNDAALASAGTRLLASRAVELEALCQTQIPPDIELIHFGQLSSGHNHPKPAIA